MNRITTILKNYLSERIPQKVTNIFWQLFNGIEVAFVHLETRLDIYKRERNILTAQNLSSLRNLASQNGFEPKLKVPAKGLLKIEFDTKIFNSVGYPLFLTPYSIFIDKITKIKYYYISDKTLKISSNSVIIPVVEGEIKNVSNVSSGNTIEKFYLLDENIAENSITVESSGIQFLQVNSFYDSNGLNDNKQYLIKFSNDIQKPIIIYIKGLTLNQTVNITYRLTFGELGNISGIHEFETSDIKNNLGELIDIGNDILIKNINGFDLGSNGTDENYLRASIGFNHGITLLFDNISYSTLINKFSTLLLQKIENPENAKTINNIYISKKQSFDIDNFNNDNVLKYKNIVDTNNYFLSGEEKTNLSKLLSDYEYTLTSHNIINSKTCNFALQITLPNNNDFDFHNNNLTLLIYREFSKFLFIRSHIINLEILFNNYMEANNIIFQYVVFNQNIENDKLQNKTEIVTPYIINHTDYLPILKGNFNIVDYNYNAYKLFFDINIVVG